MLEQIRQTGQNKIFKLLLIILALSFIIFGVGDIFKSSGNYVAKVGKDVVSLDEFNQNLRNIISSYKRNGINLTIDEVKKLQIDKFLVRDLVTNKLIEQNVESLGLIFADDLIVDKIKNNTNFKNPKTQNFDKKILDNYLANLNMTEQQFISNYKKEVASEYLRNPLLEKPSSLKILTKNIIPYKLEKRVIDLIKIENEQILKNITVTDEEMKAYFDKHQDQFLTPEYRHLSYISMDYEQIKDKMVINEEEIKKEYLDNIYEYNLPELRDFYNLVFMSKEDAEKARTELLNTKDFLAKAKEISSDQDLIFNNIDKNSLPEDIRDEIFNLKLNELSDPLKTENGWHLIKVIKETPATSKAYNEIKKQVAQNLKKKRADQLLHENSQKIEDDLASGMSLEEVAEKYGLKVNKFDSLNTESKNLTKYDNFNEVALATDEGSESPLTFTTDQDSFFIIRMDKIDKPVVKDFESIKLTIAKLIKEEKLLEALNKIENDIIKKHKDGNDIKAIANQYGYSFKESVAISRENNRKDLEIPLSLVKDVFSKSTGDITDIHKTQNNNYYLGIVKTIIKPKDLTVEEINLTEQDLKKDYVQSIQEQYIQYLYNNTKVIYNEEILNNL